MAEVILNENQNNSAKCAFKKLASIAVSAFYKFRHYSEEYGFAGLQLFMRIWIAKVFFMSGLTKISNWENTMMLFQYEYAVPLITTSFAAYSATFFELMIPPLLVLGFTTRLAAIPLLIMTAVIEFTYMEHIQHLGWALMLMVLITKGAGKFSIDCFLNKKFGK